MIKEEIKFRDSTVFEGMTSLRAILRARDEGINDRMLRTVYIDRDRMKKIAKEAGYLKAVSEAYGFSVEMTDAAALDSMTVGNSHGGIVATAGDRTIPCLSEDTSLPDDGFFAMLQGIEDPYNFGYAIRSLYACGCDGIILPERNWMTAAGVVCRSSAGASERIALYRAEAVACAGIFRQRGYTVICADEDTPNVLGECPMKTPLLLILGGEKRGISRTLLDGADRTVRIPYGRDFGASLSAASATAMFAFEVMRQNPGRKSR